MLTIFDFLYITGVDRTYPEIHVNRQTPITEKHLILTKPYGQVIKAMEPNINSYAGTIRDYNSNVAYNQNEVVFFANQLYKRNSYDIGERYEPTDILGWATFEKFDNESDNIKWNYVGAIIAYNVLKVTLPFVSNPVGGKGMVRYTEDATNIIGASKDDKSSYGNAIDTIIKQNEDILMDTYLSVDSECCETKKNNSQNGNRRFMLR